MPPPTQSFHSSSLANALQPTSSALPPTNPHANSIHYPRAEHYPMERAYSMPQVGGGGPPTPAPLQQHYYTPQMPPAPKNHSFTFTQSTLQKSQRRDDQQSLPRPGNDQRPSRVQYQLTFPINGNSSHRRSQMPPPLTISIPNSTTIFNNLCHNLETTSGRPTHNTNLRSTPLLIPRSITRGTLKYKGTMVNHSLIFNRRKRSFQGHKTRAPTAVHPQPNAQNTSSTTYRLDERSMSVSAPSRFATSIPSLSPSSTSNYAVHQSVATSPAAGNSSQSTGPASLQGYQFTLPAPPTRPPTSNALAHPPRQFAAVSAPAPAQRAHSLPRQRAVAPVGPSPLQRSMTTPGPLSANPYLHLLSIGRKQTQTVQEVNVPRPTPQLRRSATAPTVGKRRYDAEEEERQAKRARIYEFDSAPQAVQTHPLHTIEEVEEPQEKSVLHENQINLAPPSQSVSQKTYVQASKPPRCIKDYVVLRHDNLLTSAAALSESKLLHGDVLFGLPSSLQSQNPIHSIKSAAIVHALGKSDSGVESQLTMTALSAD
ncbi:hypothetical protein CPB85DRAFT_1434406 [Mucidula mucida]|nr:hypothetical protein CPB85DRAFT_1434406 [Mucidula mucida]